ncbi:hypothetical protein AB8B12_12170 [Streptomyces sp. PGLac3x]
MEILGDIARHGWIGERKNVTTKAVVSEIVYYEPGFAGEEWLEVVHVDDLGGASCSGHLDGAGLRRQFQPR